jgi:type I restriction enzyme S subunit
MSSDWTESSIGQLCKQVFSGGTPKSTVAEYFDGGTIPWLKTKEVNYSRITKTENFISELGLKNSSAKIVPINSVIVAMYGNGDTAGRVAINKIPLTTNQACCNLIVDPVIADYRYVYYYIQSQYQKLVDLKNGGAQQNLNSKLIKDYPILVPPLEEQTEIGTVLQSLDDRITLLRETNTTLEAIAQALFKSWFVDFDPVHAKQQGREPEGMDANTAALFPDSFEESELGLVPMGWKWVNLDAIAVVIMGLSPKGDSYNYDGVGVPLINGPVEYGDYFPVQTKWTNSARKFANEGDLIFCVRGSTTGRRVVSDREYCIGRGVCAIRGNNDSANFIYQTINFGIDRLLNKTTGSVFPSLSGPDIKTFKVLNPTEALITAYENTTKSILHRIQANHRKAQTLANLRDTLLPRLISGQLRPPDVETELDHVSH